MRVSTACRRGVRPRWRGESELGQDENRKGRSETPEALHQANEATAAAIPCPLVTLSQESVPRRRISVMSSLIVSVKWRTVYCRAAIF